MSRALLIAVLALSAFAILMSTQFDQRRVGRQSTAPNHAPRYSISGAQWTRLGADGQTEFRISADRIDYYDNQSAKMTQVVMDGLAAGKGPWRLTSPQGEMPAGEQRVRLTRPVVITGTMNGGAPIEVTTDELWVDGAKRELYTDAPVALRRGAQQANAVGLNADWAGQRLQLLHDVKVTYVPNG